MGVDLKNTNKKSQHCKNGSKMKKNDYNPLKNMVASKNILSLKKLSISSSGAHFLGFVGSKS